MAAATAPVLLGYDGSEAARTAVREAADLFGSRQVLLATVWEPALAYGAATMPSPGGDLQPSPMDIGAAQALTEELEAHAHRTAEEGAELARSAGLEVEHVVVADRVNVAEALIQLAEQRDVAAIVVGSRGLTGLRARLEGSTSSGVLKKATCPVVVIHDD